MLHAYQIRVTGYCILQLNGLGLIRSTIFFVFVKVLIPRISSYLFEGVVQIVATTATARPLVFK
jgi:hypothetical protein